MKRYDVTSAEDLIFIPCHLNTAQKINKTKKLLNHFSKSHFILLGSHIEIPEEIRIMADFSFVDKNNPITGVDDNFITNSKIYCFVDVFDITLTKNIPNHGYAHMLLLKTAYYLSLGWNFKRFHHISYDIPLNFCDLDKIKEHNNILKEFDVVSYKWYNNHDKIDANLFSFNTKNKIDKFLISKTFNDWDLSFNGFSTEQFLFQSFNSLNNKIFDSEERIDDSDSIECVDNDIVTYAHPYICDKFNPIILFDDKRNLTLYFKNNTDSIQNIRLILDNVEIFKMNIQPYVFMLQPICENSVTSGILKIIVNNELKNSFDVTKEYNRGKIN